MARNGSPVELENIVGLCERRGFIFASGGIYGCTSPAWDYGPLGVELKANIKRQWWQAVVTGREDVVGLDSAVILPRQVWMASGHVDASCVQLVQCQQCDQRLRADRLTGRYGQETDDLDSVPCPNCGIRGEHLPLREFDTMLTTSLGSTESEDDLHYLRPETAQGIFVNFLNVQMVWRRRPPFGIGQIGKSFRKETTPRNLLLDTHEFEQMEMEYFVEPGADEELHQYWIDERTRWYVDLGIAPDNLRHHERSRDKLSHYSRRTVDIEYRFGFTGREWDEVEGIANRTDFDLRAHSNHSGADLSFYDRRSGTHYRPYVLGTVASVSQSMMAFLTEAYTKDDASSRGDGVGRRVVLRLDHRLAPVKAAVLPLSRNGDLSPRARDLAAALRKEWNVEFDDAGTIGHRYRRQDEIGTPFCVTVDFDSLTDQAVKVRDRDTTAQERVSIDKLLAYLDGRLRHPAAMPQW